jgi:hypothetical protein
MNDTTDSLMIQLGTYVSELKAQRASGKILAARGSTLKIFVAAGKLREIGEPGIENSIAMALAEAQLDFDATLNYRNICWHCYREEGFRRFLDARTDRTCPECGWLICFQCGRCRAPEFGGCNRNHL